MTQDTPEKSNYSNEEVVAYLYLEHHNMNATSPSDLIEAASKDFEIPHKQVVHCFGLMILSGFKFQ